MTRPGPRRTQRLFTAAANGSAARRLDTIQKEIPMKHPCPACALGPSGIEGHPGLRVRTLGPLQITFTCTACESLWMRDYVRGEEAYTWKPLAASAPGLFMPG